MQPPPPPAPPPQPPPGEVRLGAARGAARPCDGRFAMVTLEVRDRAGAPVTGARITARLAGTRAPFAVQPREEGAGSYLLVDDTALGHVAAGAGSAREVTLDVTVERGGRQATVRQVLARSANGCHVVRAGGPEVVTL